MTQRDSSIIKKNINKNNQCFNYINNWHVLKININ